MEGTYQQLVELLMRRLTAFAQTLEPEQVLSEVALAEADALVLIVDNPQDVTSKEELDAFLTGMELVATLHWDRFIASDKADRSSFTTAYPLFRLLHSLNPESAPPELAELFAQEENEPALLPMNVMWAETAGDLMDASIEADDPDGLDQAVYLMERALAGLPTDHEDRPRYVVNLANALFLGVKYNGNRAHLDRAIELIEAIVAETSRDDEVYSVRAARLASMHKRLFSLTGELSALTKSVDASREVIDLLPNDDIDAGNHQADYADSAALLFEATGDLSVGDDAILAFAKLRLNVGEQSLPRVDKELARLMIARFDNEPPASSVEAIKLMELAVAERKRFESSGELSYLDRSLVSYAHVLATLDSTFTNYTLVRLGILLRERFTVERNEKHLDTSLMLLWTAMENAADEELRNIAVEQVELSLAPRSVQGQELRSTLESLAADVRSEVIHAIQAERTMPTVAYGEGVAGTVLMLTREFSALLYLGDWQDALLRSRLLIAALQDADPGLNWPRAEASVAFLDVARGSLSLGANLEVYEAARRAGEWALEWATDQDNRLAGTAAFRLGTLHLEPYTRFRGPEDMSFSTLNWQRRGRADSLDPRVSLPAPPIGLGIAVQYLRQATTLRTGEDLGEAYRRLAGALIALLHIGEPIDNAELTYAAAKALQLMPPQRLAERVNLAGHLSTADRLREAESVASALEQDMAGYIAASDADHALIAAAETAKLLMDTQPARALALLRKARELGGNASHEEYLLQALSAEAELAAEEPDDSAVSYFIKANEHLRAARSGAANQAVSIAAATWEFLSAGLTQRAVSCLELLFHRAGDVDDEGVPQVLAHLGMAARYLFATEPEAAGLLRNIYARMLGGLLERGSTDVMLSILLSHSKGALLREALAMGAPAIAALGDEERDMLTAIDLNAPLDDVLGAEELVVAWADAVQWRPATDEGRLRNRQRAFDQHLTRLMLQARSAFPLTFMEISTIQGALDEPTVLLVHAEILVDDTRGGHLQLVITSDDTQAFFAVDEEPYGDILMTGDFVFRSSTTAAHVAELRTAIQRDPGPGFVDPAAHDLLTSSDFARLFSRLAEEALDRLRAAGKDRLLISPAGPFHFHPIHLIGDRPLATDWKIAYLPNLGLLNRDTEIRQGTLTSIGLDYLEHPALPPLTDSIDEVTTCATLFGTAPVTNSAATRERVLTALRTSRYVHIAAHGEHNVDAPAFQVIHLADGRLFAYELLTEDFTGLELVTLSACETGLGRIDRGDNLRGVPAALLLAGVCNVVATLWPVYDKAAAYFFPNLYRELAAGRSLWDAFTLAQQLTRQRFPQYRDWGAFTLMGSHAR